MAAPKGNVNRFRHGRRSGKSLRERYGVLLGRLGEKDRGYIERVLKFRRCLEARVEELRGTTRIEDQLAIHGACVGEVTRILCELEIREIRNGEKNVALREFNTLLKTYLEAVERRNRYASRLGLQAGLGTEDPTAGDPWLEGEQS